MNLLFTGRKLVASLLGAFLCILPVVAEASSSGRNHDTASEATYVSYKQQLECLARAIYFEARGEPERGQEAVALVIINRTKSAYYPDTVCDVVYQNDHRRNACQFSFACDGKPDVIKEEDAFEKAKRIAREIFSCGLDRCDDSTLFTRSTHYHADYVSPRWAKKLQRTGQVGRHIFYYTASM